MNAKHKIDGKNAAMIVVCTISCIQVWQPPQAIADRTIVFPKTPQPIGTLMTHPMNASAPLRMLGTSKGSITLKDSDALYLVPTPEGMRYFDQLSKLKPADLQHLRLHDVPISQSNFKTVSQMSGLTRLDLSFSDVDDSVFQYIAALKNLEELDLSSTLVRGTTLNKLKSLKNLTSLDLAGTRIHDFAVITIVGCCPKLEKLNLANTYITDDAISKIAKLQNLHKLRLSKTNITDKNIDKLLGLKHLQKLSLSHTKITPKKLRELKAAKPTCKFILSETDD
ncbi:MAG: leucine-rich repeat domain-containing protein [Candidatus Obscuribacterales bacterium]|nr:leucine-rich repeat domain-containing protein [Candidatus Obscuribacterales bacterium]